MQGIGCWASGFDEPGRGYLFLISPHLGGIAIVGQDETNKSLEDDFYLDPLDERSDAVAGVGATNKIRSECPGQADGVHLTMFLNGRQVAETTDPTGFHPFEAYGFAVISTKAGADIRFDNFLAEALE